MDLTLYVNVSEKNKLTKSLTNELHLTGNLRNESSVTDPVILLQVDNPTTYNYVYIPQFNRYYFITDMVSVRTGLWQLKLHVDVLMSFNTQIGELRVVLSDTEKEGATNYISGDPWITNVKDTTNILVFPKKLLDSGEYILITAGG